MEKIYYLIYVSRISFQAGITPSTLADIYRVAKLNNPVYQVTGFLCFGNGYFFQYIEGNKDTILQLFDHIKRDARNRQVRLVSSGFHEQRLFANWQMHMVNLNHPDTPEPLVSALQPLLNATAEPEQADRVVSFMQSQYAYGGLSQFEQVAQKNTSYYKISLYNLIKTHRAFLLVQVILAGLLILSVGQFMWMH